MPRGKWRWGANVYGYRYHQSVNANTQSYQIAGRSQTTETTLERLLLRGRRYRSSLDLKLGQRHSQTFVAGSELITQRRKQTYAEIGVNLREYLGPAQLDLRLAHRRGLPWLGGDQDQHPRFDNAPTLRYRINNFDANLDLPFRVGPVRSNWSSDLHWQQSPDLLYGSELAPIGGRYTVNGFDGEQTLAGRTGGYWRNSLSLDVHRVVQPYAGADVGRVEEVQRIGLRGGTLAGAYVGVRGSAWGAVNWDGFVAWPLLRPDAWVQKGHTTGFRISLQI